MTPEIPLGGAGFVRLASPHLLFPHWGAGTRRRMGMRSPNGIWGATWFWGTATKQVGPGHGDVRALLH